MKFKYPLLTMCIFNGICSMEKQDAVLTLRAQKKTEEHGEYSIKNYE